MKSGEGQHGVIQIRAQDKSPKVKFQKQAGHTGDAGNEHAGKHAQKQPTDEEKGEQAGSSRTRDQVKPARPDNHSEWETTQSTGKQDQHNTADELGDAPSGYRVLPRSQLASGFKQTKDAPCAALSWGTRYKLRRWRETVHDNRPGVCSAAWRLR